MQNLITSLMVLGALFQTSRVPHPTRSDPLLVRAIVDGDTIDVASVGHVRLIGITAPAVGRGAHASAPFALRARDQLSSLVLSRWVRLEWDGSASARTRGAQAYVIREDGLFVNAEMARSGLVRVTGSPTLGRLNELSRAEHEAQAFRRGIWGPDDGSAPSGYTRPPAPKPPRTKSKR